MEQGERFALAKQPEHSEQGETHAEQCLFAGTLAEEERPLQQGEQRNQGADHPHIGSRGAVGGVIGQTLVEHHTERRQHQQLAEPGANLATAAPQLRQAEGGQRQGGDHPAIEGDSRGVEHAGGRLGHHGIGSPDQHRHQRKEKRGKDSHQRLLINRGPSLPLSLYYQVA